MPVAERAVAPAAVVAVRIAVVVDIPVQGILRQDTVGGVECRRGRRRGRPFRWRKMDRLVCGRNLTEISHVDPIDFLPSTSLDTLEQVTMGILKGYRYSL